jgi:intracellular sulfur oxidation DsrE/DsrF family protein
MEKNNSPESTNRRNFINTFAAGAAAFGIASIAPSVTAKAEENNYSLPNPDDPDAWFAQMKGKHRVVFDVTEPHEIFPFAWPRVFLITNEMTGSPAKDCNVIVGLRHASIGYAFEDKLWTKYKMGEMFKANDPKTKAPSLRNPFWKPQKGDFSVPGIGPVEIGIDELQASGVMFYVCNMAMIVYSAVAAGMMNMKAEDIMAEWKAGLLPGVHVVPSGVWAAGRAQEYGCKYIFVG